MALAWRRIIAPLTNRGHSSLGAAALKIAHCPLHGPSWTRKVGRKITAINADSAGTTESYRGVPWLSHRLRYRCITGPNSSRVDARGRRVGWDVAILVKRTHKVLEKGAVKVADQIGVTREQIKYHPERWLVWVVYQTRSGFTVAHFNLHPQPGPTHSTPVATEYAAHMNRYAAEVDRVRETYPGVVVVTTGDMQLGAGGTKPWVPSRVFNLLGLVAENNKIDWVAHTPNVVKTGGRRILPRAIGPGMDHPWMVRTYRHAA